MIAHVIYTAQFIKIFSHGSSLPFMDLLCPPFFSKSKYPVTESRNLRMLPDHTGLLESNEAFIAVGDESAQYDVERTGSIVAMRFPSYFTSDIRKLTIVSKADLIQRCPERGRFFAGIVAGLVLSTKGAKSEAERMSGGDFDGDTGE